jgi:transposase
MRKAAYRWCKAYKEDGLEGLMDSRKGPSEKHQTRELTIDEKNARLEAQIKLLKADNELLKKLDMMERG